MQYGLLVVTVKKWLKSAHICVSYRKIKTRVPLFWKHLVSSRLQATGQRLSVADCGGGISACCNAGPDVRYSGRRMAA